MFTQLKVAGFNQYVVSHYKGDRTFSGKTTTIFYLKTPKIYKEFWNELNKWVYHFHYAQAKLKDLVAQWKASYVNSYDFIWEWPKCKLKVNWIKHKMNFNYTLETYK